MIGSQGERKLQKILGSQERATRFYNRQVHDHLTDGMQSFIARQEMVFIATSDAQGNCDCSPRFGKPGFVVILDEKTIAYPEFRGNGVFASLGNIMENPHIGLVFVDFLDTTVGLHVNGRSKICTPDDIPRSGSPFEDTYEVDGTIRLIDRWVKIEIQEAYIHCSKHIPHLQKLEKSISWGTDDSNAKTDDFFVRNQSVSFKSFDLNKRHAKT